LKIELCLFLKSADHDSKNTEHQNQKSKIKNQKSKIKNQKSKIKNQKSTIYDNNQHRKIKIQKVPYNTVIFQNGRKIPTIGIELYYPISSIVHELQQ